MTAPVIVLVTGLQGTGKSTVAGGVARLLPAPVFAWDWSMAALTPFDAVQATLRQMDAPTYRAIGWAMMFQSARLQLSLGSSVVLDGLARDDDLRAVRALGQECDVPSVVALLRCDDEELQRARVKGRARAIPGWHELTWEDVARTRRRWTEPSDVDLVLDATDSIDVLVDTVVERVRRISSGES